MASQQDAGRRPPHAAARDDRLAKALRENLKRRKAQQRGRADVSEAQGVEAREAEPAAPSTCQTSSPGGDAI